MTIRLNAQQLRTTEPDSLVKEKIKRNPIYLICENVLDTYNVGAIFRLADAAAVEKIYLCGQTETPPNPKIKKASVSTWKWVDWEYDQSAVKVIKKLKACNPNIKIIVVEQNTRSIFLKDYKPHFPLVLVIGNESYGVSKEVLGIADEIIELPMYGINTSLNVMVCAGIVLYRILEYI